MDYLNRTAHASTSVMVRLFYSMWRQAALAPICPTLPRLENQLALVTGGNAGIGYEIAAGLARRGAEVVIAARNAATAQQAATKIKAETNAVVHTLPLDLADINSLKPFVEGLAAIQNGRPISIFVQNAGV